MEERRRSLWLLAAAALSFPAWACDPAIEGTRLESARYVLAYKAQKVSVAEHFALDVAACAKPGHPPPESLKVDAHMPEHRHGMNYRTKVTPRGAGRYSSEGWLFHMPGRWEFRFDLGSERLTHSVQIE